MTALLLRSGPVGLLLALALMPATGHAAGSPDSSPASVASGGRRVLLVTPEPDGDIAPAVVTRLRGELRAARFEMDVATISADAPRRATVEEMAAREGTSAALGIFFGGGRVEMWATDASAGRTLMENLRLDAGAPDRRAAIVAVKAVDLLKATLAEIWTSPAPPVVAEHPPEPLETVVTLPRPPVVIEHPDEDAAARRADRFSLTMGAGWLQADGMNGWAPTIALSTALGSSGLAVRLTGSALGSSSDVTQTAGSAQLNQQLVLAELMFWSPAWHRLRAALALGIGAHRLSIDGTGAPGFSGVNSSAWSTASSGGISVSWNLPAQLLLALDARAVENWTATSVQIHGTEVARIGRPIVWVALAAGVRFR